MRWAISGSRGRRCAAGWSAHRPGHTLNNRLLRALFADAEAWRETAAHPGVRGPAFSDWAAIPAAA